MITRRSALRWGLAGAAATAVPGCSGPPRTAGPTPSPSASSTPSPGPLQLATWPDYLDTDAAGGHPTLAAFTRRTGIRVAYHEDVTDNVTFVAAYDKANRAGAPTRDLVVLTDSTAATWVAGRRTQALDRTAMPHTSALLPALGSPDWDPGRAHSMPWQAGLTGIAYNARLVERPVTTITELLTRRDLRGRVTVLKEATDTIGLIALDGGDDPSDLAPGALDRALERLHAAHGSGQVRAAVGNEYVDDLRAGRTAACIAWSGDVLQLQAEDPTIKFVIPPAGAMIWADNLLVTTGSARRSQAEAFIDWYYRPDVAARVSAYVQYICPVVGAQEVLARTDPALAANPLVFPTDDILARTYLFAATQATAPAALASGLAEALA